MWESGRTRCHQCILRDADPFGSNRECFQSGNDDRWLGKVPYAVCENRDIINGICSRGEKVERVCPMECDAIPDCRGSQVRMRLLKIEWGAWCHFNTSVCPCRTWFKLLLTIVQRCRIQCCHTSALTNDCSQHCRAIALSTA